MKVLGRAALPVSKFPRRAVVSGLSYRAFVAGDFVEVFVFFEEIGHIEKRVALQPQIDEGRLHAGQDAGDTSFMNAASE